MIYWNTEKQGWFWDRWWRSNLNCPLAGSPLRPWLAVHLHFHDGDEVREEDLPRLQLAKVQYDRERANQVREAVAGTTGLLPGTGAQEQLHGGDGSATAST